MSFLAGAHVRAKEVEELPVTVGNYNFNTASLMALKSRRHCEHLATKGQDSKCLIKHVTVLQAKEGSHTPHRAIQTSATV